MHYHREQREEFIRHLADRFPKCFFDNPATRLALKRNIETDLEKQNVLDHEKIVQAVEWYKSDFRYMRKILTGAERVDLDGKKAGSVTLQEQEDTRRRMLAKKADGRISKDWIKLGPNFGAKPANGAVATVPAELAPSPKSINTEHLRARIALFESALVGSPNKKIAKQMAADVAKMVADEMAALVKAL